MPKQTFFNLPDDKREHIIQIAIDEFVNSSFEKASISRIVENAGIAKGSFYQYFSGKEDLYQYLFSLTAKAKAELLSSPPPNPEMGIFAFLCWMMEKGVEFEVAHPQMAQLGYRALRDNGLPDTFLAEAKEAGNTFVKQLIAQGKSQNDVAPSIDEDLAAFIFNTIFSELGQYMYQRLDVGENGRLPNGQSFFESDEARAILEQTLHILEHGMGNK